LLQVLSHELRTPVSVIEGFAGFVADRFDDLSRAKMRELAEPLHRATARIVRLAGNIAAAVAYGGDATRSRPRPFAADQILSDVVDEFPQHRMRLRLPGDVAPDARLWADPPMAVRALVIVVENAFDFSPPEAPVELEIRAGGDSFEFRVSDRGPGVDPVFRDRMFEPFAQADMSETRRRPGLGVGLYLASRIMETHEGSITYEDRPGGGATFVLRFPAPLDDGAEQTAIPGLGCGAGFPASGTEAKGVHAA
jgi:two-component system sensor histidine kinase KdpD